MKMLDAFYMEDEDPMRFEPAYLSDHVLDPALFIVYTILIGLTMITCIIFPIILVVNREVFSFSFTITLVQIIICGFCKILTRTISYFGLTFLDLYSIELTFDFGVLLFITLMTINRLLVIATPKNCFIHSNKILQVAFVLMVWILLAIVLTVFRLGQCVRFIQDDKRIYDTCFNLFSTNIFARAKFGNWLEPIVIIRTIVVTGYDVLPLFCLALYVFSAIILMLKRRAIPRIQSHQHVEWRVFFHGFVIFVVYGLASLINIIMVSNQDPLIEGALAQFVMFVYVVLDVTTILCIPLVIFLTVPAVRTSPTASFVKMSSALEIFDYAQTLGITACLLVTIPAACFVYFKLLFYRPFSGNNTFKLIVVNGITELLNCIGYLILLQLTTYPFMVEFYTALHTSRVVQPLSIISTLFAALSLHTSLFIALNRLKTILFIRKKTNDSTFFWISLFISIILALPSVLDLCFFTTVVYLPFNFNGSLSVYPKNEIGNDILRTVSDIIRVLVSLATLIVNIILSVLISRERKFLDISERQRFNGEKGLIVTSIVSYTFYMIYFVNNVIARYFNSLFCGFAQWLFLGLNSITPFWCLLLFTPSVRRLALNLRGKSTATTHIRHTVTSLSNQLVFEMSSALDIFDYAQTVVIAVCLLVTIPSACFVYFKLLFFRPFAGNNTFKLIVLNGMAELLNCIGYLILYQLTTFPFMVEFYTAIQNSGLVAPLTIASALFSALSLHTSLFIALNRLKTIMFIREKNNDTNFFWMSVLISIVLALPSVLDLCFFTTFTYIPFMNNGALSVFPNNEITNEILRTVSDIIRVVVSLATLVINIILCVLITRERKFIDLSDRQKFNGERGLIITSIVSYTFYMIYFVNTVEFVLARYLNILLCGYAQWLFLGLNSITPFWCLLLFTPSVRRLVFSTRLKTSATSNVQQTVASLSKVGS